MFKKFQGRYGSKWVASIEGIEDIAIDEWAVGLAGLTGPQIARGLKTWKADWPPSRDEFVKICKPPMIQSHITLQTLTLQKSNAATGARAINSLRAALNGLSD